MYDSGITAAALISEIQQEADVAIGIPDSFYIRQLNTIEQMLYSEIIKEQRRMLLIGFLSIGDEKEKPYKLLSFPIEPLEEKPEDEAVIRFTDIAAVYQSGVELIKSTLIGAEGDSFRDCYYNNNGEIGLYIKEVGDIYIIYNVRPKLKTEDNVNALNIMVPTEFVNLVSAKLRGEGYKLANEDNLSAKWLNDYNALLQDFIMWVQSHKAKFGE